MHNWAVSQSAMSLRSYFVKSSAITSQRCVTVLLDSWRALIEDNIYLFLKSWNKESAASTKASFIISPSWKDFLCLMMEWLTSNDASTEAFAYELCCVKNDCCPMNCDFSSLTFLFQLPLKIHLLWNSDGSLTNHYHKCTSIKDICPPHILNGSGLFYVFYLVQLPHSFLNILSFGDITWSH